MIEQYKERRREENKGISNKGEKGRRKKGGRCIIRFFSFCGYAAKLVKLFFQHSYSSR